MQLHRILRLLRESGTKCRRGSINRYLFINRKNKCFFNLFTDKKNSYICSVVKLTNGILDGLDEEISGRVP
jgi:hypothetical protein